MNFWEPWPITTSIWLVTAAAGGLLLCIPLSRLAFQLPRRLDPTLSREQTALHRRYRALFVLLTLLCAIVCAWRFGATPAGAAAILFSVGLLALAWIDAETGYLPDALTLSLLWLGLLVNVNGTFSALPDAVIGAAAGYVALWLLNAGFYIFTHRQGMGRGDFKLLAALGAWLGWMSLPWLLLVASLLALFIALVRRIYGQLQAGAPFSFGPYLAVAGIAALVTLTPPVLRFF